MRIGWCRPAARHHGEHRRLLESGLDSVGGSVHPVVGQCPARQGIRLHRPTPRRITPHSIGRMTDISTRSLINRNQLPAAEFSRRGPGSCHTGCGAVPIQSRTKLRSRFASSSATFAIIANFNPALEYLTLIHRQVSHSRSYPNAPFRHYIPTPCRGQGASDRPNGRANLPSERASIAPPGRRSNYRNWH